MRYLQCFNRGDKWAMVSPIYKKLDIILFLVTRGIQISLHRVCILIYSLDTSVCSRVVKTHILILFLAIVLLFSVASIYILV